MSSMKIVGAYTGIQRATVQKYDIGIFFMLKSAHCAHWDSQSSKRLRRANF